VKTTLAYWRTPSYNYVRLILYPIFALIFGSVFFQLGYSTQGKVFSQIALIYLSMDFIGVMNMMTVLEITCAERTVYYRERASNMYSPLPYSLAIFLAEVPYLTVSCLTFVSIEYWMVGRSNSPVLFFFYFFIMYLYTSSCTYIGQLMAVAMPNAKVANVAVGATSVVLNLFSGYLVPFPFMHSYYSWIRWILPSSYALSAMVSSEMGICTGDENGCAEFTAPNPMTQEPTDYVTATYVLDNYDFHHDRRFLNMGVLIGFWVGLQILIYLSLRFISHLKR